MLLLSQCIEAVIIWQHGTYTVNDNGTISTSSDVFAADGRIQTQNACSAVTSSIYCASISTLRPRGPG
jgi:hypothetical protein